MLPKACVASLVLASAAARLKVHQRDAVSMFGNQRWRICPEERHDHLVGWVFVADEADRTTVRNESIPGLQFSDAALVRVPDAPPPIGSLPAFVAAFDPASLLGFKQRRALALRFL